MGNKVSRCRRVQTSLPTLRGRIQPSNLHNIVFTAQQKTQRWNAVCPILNHVRHLQIHQRISPRTDSHGWTTHYGTSTQHPCIPRRSHTSMAAETNWLDYFTTRISEQGIKLEQRTQGII